MTPWAIIMRASLAAAVLAAGTGTSTVRTLTVVYVGDADSQNITVLKLETNDDLTPIETVAVPGPAKPGLSLPLAISPNKEWLFTALRNASHSADVFAIDARTGRLMYTGSVRPWAADIHLTPDGKYLYASERTTSTLAAFRVDPNNGRLTVIDSYQTARQPRAFNIDPSGRYLLSIGALSDSMTLHSIDHESGKLTVLREYPMEKKPDWVAIVQLP